MATSYIHTCYRIRDPQKSEDFYVNKLGMKKVGEMDLGSATNHFFAFEEALNVVNDRFIAAVYSPMLIMSANRRSRLWLRHVQGAPEPLG